MTDTNPPTGRKVLHYFAGSVAGAIMGVLMLAAILTLMTPFYPGEQGLSIVAFAVLGFIPVLIVGGTVGALFIRRVRNASYPRRTVTIGLTIYALTIVTGFIVVWFLLPYMDGISSERRNIRVRDIVGKTFATGQKSWKQVYVDRYPYTEASLPDLLGPIQYPTARLVSWDDIPGQVPGWNILTATDDSADQVLAFYAALLPGGIEGYPSSFLIDNTYAWSTHSGILPAVDNVEARVTLEGDETGIRIRYTLYAPIMIDPNRSAPWSGQKSETFLANARAKRGQYRDAIASENADWIYPGATYTWGSLGGRKQLAYETSDSLDQVVAYYESVKGTSSLSNGLYSFRPNNNGWNPEFTVYPVGDKVRIHFRYLRQADRF